MLFADESFISIPARHGIIENVTDSHQSVIISLHLPFGGEFAKIREFQNIDYEQCPSSSINGWMREFCVLFAFMSKYQTDREPTQQVENVWKIFNQCEVEMNPGPREAK